MRILVETSGGGGIVLVIALALLAGHGSGAGAALLTIVIVLAVIIALAIAGGVTVLILRARRESRGASYRAEVVPGGSSMQPPGARASLADRSPAALEPPREVCLPADQLAELAEILRQHQRPDEYPPHG